MCLLCPKSVERETAELLFNAIDKHFQESTTLLYDYLVGLDTDGANVMLRARNSVMSRLRCKQPALVALHCHCYIATLIANEACKVLPDELEDLKLMYGIISRRAQGGCDSLKKFRVLWNASHSSC